MADLQDDATRVVLALATPLASPASYTLTVRDVADRRGNAIGTAPATFFFGQGAAAEPRDLVINEFLYDEPTTDNPGEFVELFNRTDQTFDLRQFTLNDGTGDDQPVTDEARFVGPGGYAVIVEDGDLFQAVFPGVDFVEQPSWSALNNSGDVIVLKYQGTVIDQLTYSPAWGGEDASVERRDPDGPSVQANFATTTDLDGGTPGEQNTRFAPDVAGPTLLAAAASPDGRTVTVTLDEPADPASVTAAAFAVSGGQAVTAAAYDADALTVTLALSGTLAAGESTVTATGLRDLLGNATATTSATVAFTPDEAPPALARATALTATTVRVTFSEPVTPGLRPGRDVRRRGWPGGGLRRHRRLDVRRRHGGRPDAGGPPRRPDALRPDRFWAGGRRRQRVRRDRGRAFSSARPTRPRPATWWSPRSCTTRRPGSDGEYVEILNTTADGVFSLGAITLDDGDDRDPLTREPAVLLPGEYVAPGPRCPGLPGHVPGRGVRRGRERDRPVELGRGRRAARRRRRAGLGVLRPRLAPRRAGGRDGDLAGAPRPGRRPQLGRQLVVVAGGSWGHAVGAQLGVDLGHAGRARDGADHHEPVRADAGRGGPDHLHAVVGGGVGARADLRRRRPARPRARRGAAVGPDGDAGLWDGTGDDRRPQRAGIYVVLVDAVDAQGGTTDTLRGAVVLARPE